MTADAAVALAATYLKRRHAMNSRPHSSPPRAGSAEFRPPLRKDSEEAKSAPRGRLSLDEKLDEALKGTFPASDPFFLV